MTHRSPTNSTIVSIAEFRERNEQGAASQVEAYWDSLRRGRIMPDRAEIDPRGIAGALEFAFILERVARGVARFRLAGMHLNDLMGMEVRGMPLTAMILPGSRDAAAEAMSAVFDEPAISRLTLRAETGLGRPDLQARMLLLPLRSDLGDVTRALGCFVTEGSIGRAPRRFEILHQSHRTLIGYGDRPPLRSREPSAAPTGPSPRATQTRTLSRPKLTLVETSE